MKLTDDEKTAHSNAWRTHRESTNQLKTSRGKVYSLLLGQCTQVLVDKMKQDSNWVKISTSFNSNLLLKLIENFVLNQSDNQYMTAVAGALEDMAGPHLVQYHVSHQKLGHAKT